MVNPIVRIVLGVVTVCGVAAAACVIGNDRYAGGDADLAMACAGHSVSPQLENALFSARARTESGADPICAPDTTVDDDVTALELSASAFHDHARSGGYSRR
jgi:hypothetical protein